MLTEAGREAPAGAGVEPGAPGGRGREGVLLNDTRREDTIPPPSHPQIPKESKGLILRKMNDDDRHRLFRALEAGREPEASADHTAQQRMMRI